MHNSIFKAVSLAAASLLFTDIANANDRPIEILLNHVNLDLSNPEATASRIRDKGFKSNDPSISSRIYNMKDGARVKLVGRDFSKASNIDKIKVTYPRNEIAYKASHAALIESFGAPSAKRPDILVWRLDNKTNSSTQSKYIKVIAGFNNAEKRTITANRQRGGKGNNPRNITPQPTLIPFKNSSKSQLRTNERD